MFRYVRNLHTLRNSAARSTLRNKPASSINNTKRKLTSDTASIDNINNESKAKIVQYVVVIRILITYLFIILKLDSPSKNNRFNINSAAVGLAVTGFLTLYSVGEALMIIPQMQNQH